MQVRLNRAFRDSALKRQPVNLGKSWFIKRLRKNKRRLPVNVNRIFLILFCLSIHVIASATTHTIVVAPGGKDVFDPVSLTINVGDTVRWTFAEDFHTVTSSTGNNCSSS